MDVPASHWQTAPHRALRERVAAVAGSTDAGRECAPVRVVPGPGADLLASLSLDAPGELVELAVYGLKTRALVVANAQRVENVALQVRAPHVQALFGVDAYELVDRAVPLALLWGRRAAHELAGSLARARGFDARKAALERALLERAGAAPDPAARLVAEATARIDAAGGRIRIGALARALGTGERRLQRLFRRCAGPGPKEYAEIVRFRRAHDALARGAAQSDVAHACGYADQAHLLREFRRFAGASPRAVGFVQSREAAAG
jgi:AraC-like DNA-binding protein